MSFKNDDITIQRLSNLYRHYIGKRVVVRTITGHEVTSTMKKIKDINNLNVNSFYGVAPQNHNIHVAWAYCSKGSLMDVLQNDVIEMDWMFRLSFANDIIKGLSEIHRSPIGVHGNLTSSNCLIDNRWVCKLSNFGLSTIRDKCTHEVNRGWNKKDLWKAPELLLKNGTEPSKESDMYSYGLIMYEIQTRDDIFGTEISENGTSVEAIISKIIRGPLPENSEAAAQGKTKAPTRRIRPLTSSSKPPPASPEDIGHLESMELVWGDIPEQKPLATIEENQVINLIRNHSEGGPFRPALTPCEGAPEGYMELMQKCWEDNPEMRPNIKDVAKVITKLQKDSTKGGSLVDHMMLMMEKYSNNLEDIVAERTEELREEKLKTEKLLYKMLPESVANRLKEGQPVVAERFDSVTIFFSDIVGFTSLCSQSSPLQVVEMLNDLYSCFDKILDGFDVYKVETIGDAYMVVSGLPVRNKGHAGEIASMSLDLLCAVNGFRIKHRPDMQMQLRIGMHTGSCVAGVVGEKMPRYCLFGDTVNYASRMESSGLALRIHVSPESKLALDELGGYHLEERGEVHMKGKGSIVTYFLAGKDGFDKQLPDLSRAASLQEHSFK